MLPFGVALMLGKIDGQKNDAVMCHGGVVGETLLTYGTVQGLSIDRSLILDNKVLYRETKPC